jgi:hypothetical protein
MTGLGKAFTVGALVAVPLAVAAIPKQSADAQVYVTPYSYAYPYACDPFYAPYYCGYGGYGYPYYYGGAGWGWGGWYGRGWGHGGWGGGWHGGSHGGHGGGGHFRH